VAHDVFFQRRHKKFRHKLVIVRNSEHHNLPVLEKSWKVLRDGPNASNVIETVSKHGYRFTASVETLGAELPGTSHVILAVLPFESFGASSDLEYLADGLTEEVIAALGQIEPKHISVIGRTTMMAYKRTTKSLSDIGRELGAAFLVESSVRAEDARLRITSKLIRAREQVQNLGGIV